MMKWKTHTWVLVMVVLLLMITNRQQIFVHVPSVNPLSNTRLILGSVVEPFFFAAKESNMTDPIIRPTVLALS